MKKIVVLLLLSVSIQLHAQKDTNKIAASIVDEATELYKSEMASWYGTDLFLEKYKDHKTIGGYLSYSQDSIAKCIFFSKGEKAKVIGEVIFDANYTIATAEIKLVERDFENNEKDLHELRTKALQLAQTDTLFKVYNNTNLNFIPLIYKGKKKVYVLTGPEVHGVVVFGNDYLISFDNDNNITDKKELHKNIIPIEYGKEIEGRVAISSMHSHNEVTGDFITVTDVCTLMLYGKFTGWKQHRVMSKNYMNTWDIEKKKLNVMTKEEYYKEKE